MAIHQLQRGGGQDQVLACVWMCLEVCVRRCTVFDHVCAPHKQKKSEEREQKSTYTRSYRDRIVLDMHERSIMPDTSSSHEALRPRHRSTEVVLEAEELAQEFSNKVVSVSLVL
jgi:hypothetical protein